MIYWIGFGCSKPKRLRQVFQCFQTGARDFAHCAQARQAGPAPFVHSDPAATVVRGGNDWDAVFSDFDTML